MSWTLCSVFGMCCSAHITNCIAACEPQDTAHSKPNFIFVIANFALFFLPSFSSFVFLFLVYSFKLDSFPFYWAVSCMCVCVCVQCACSSKPKSFTNFRFFFSAFPFTAMHTLVMPLYKVVGRRRHFLSLFRWIYCIRGCCLSPKYITSRVACSNFYVVSVSLTSTSPQCRFVCERITIYIEWEIRPVHTICEMDYIR